MDLQHDPLEVLLTGNGDDRTFVREPWSVYEEFRAHRPVAWSECGQCFFVFGYQNVCDFLTRAEMTAEHPFRGSRVAFGSTILDSEGEDHARLRQMLGAALRPSRFEQLGEAVVRPALREALAAVTVIDDTSEDLTPICEGVPVAVICAILGIPPADVPWVQTTMAPLVHVVDRGPRGVPGLSGARRTLLGYLDEVVLGPDSSSEVAILRHALSQAVEEGIVSRAEAQGHALLLLVAGSATTTCAMANAAVHCFQPPGSQAFGAEHRTGDVVREALRLEPPLRFTPRFAAADFEAGDVAVRKGDAFQLCIASANRDDAVFEQASQFVPDRRQHPAPVTFGRGLHGCLGAALGQLEVAAFLDVLHATLGPCTVVASDELVPLQSFRRPREIRLRRIG